MSGVYLDGADYSEVGLDVPGDLKGTTDCQNDGYVGYEDHEQ